VQPKNADARLSETLSTPGVTSLTFIGIILFSLYLSLSALLAVPLMEKQPIPANYEQADFEARITREFLSEQEFYKKYPTVDLPQAVQQSATTTEWLNAAGISGSFLDRLSLWNANRSAAHQALERRKSIAIETFRSQSALGLGGREVVSHDAALQRWAIEERGEIYRQISNCLSAAQQAVRAFTVIDATIKNNTPDRPASSGFVGAILNADNQCSINDFGTNRDAPGRANRVEGLTSFIRDWTRWLIGPESMPLVIIVGLVGFSFLGACLSRIIRRGIGEELKGLSLTDLLLVVLSGASAALMMFLASYGGLAILGDSPGNPSSYVVFALCLVAAIFSEDVWAWARIKLLGRFTDGGGEADKADDGGEKAPAETPKDKVTPQPAG
jgi:hypothetical protein